MLSGDLELRGVCDERAASQHQVELLMSETDSLNNKSAKGAKKWNFTRVPENMQK